MTRTADGLDEPSLDRLAGWLGERADVVGPLAAERIAGGRSNLTFLLTDTAGGHWVLRRPPLGRLLPTAHDMVREHRVLAALSGTEIPVPAPVGLCDDDSLIGARFYVMQFVRGRTLRTTQDAEALGEPACHTLGEGFPRVLARLHQVDPAAVGLGDRERGHGYVERQLHVWRRQLDGSGGRDLPAMRDLGERLARRVPPQRHTGIVHGDYRLDNLLVDDDGTVAAVVDWELWTVGDPLADLAQSLVYWLDDAGSDAPLGESPTTSPHLPTRAEVLEAYRRASPYEVPDDTLAFYAAFATWRFAAILEGVYQRHLAGAYGGVEDTSWRRFEHMVPALADQAVELLEGRA